MYFEGTENLEKRQVLVESAFERSESARRPNRFSALCVLLLLSLSGELQHLRRGYLRFWHPEGLTN